jgi:hypothetical protein
MRLVALSIAFALTQAVDKPAPVPFPHDWPVGTRYHVELTKSREDVEEAQPPKVSSTRTPIEVEVIARRDDGYRVRWTFGHPDAASKRALQQRARGKIAGLVEGLRHGLRHRCDGFSDEARRSEAMETHFDAAARKPWCDAGAVLPSRTCRPCARRR